MTSEEDQVTQEFLDQCVVEGRLSEKELAEISLYRGNGRSSTKPPLRTFDDFLVTIGNGLNKSPEHARVFMQRQLLSHQLLPLHIELWINYPAYTEAELADIFGVPRQRVSRALASVRRAWPDLRLDTEGKWGVPALNRMLRVGGGEEGTPNHIDNAHDVIKF
jgi:hypothetical protein